MHFAPTADGVFLGLRTMNEIDELRIDGRIGAINFARVARGDERVEIVGGDFA